MKVTVYNVNAQKVGEITLPAAVFDAKVSNDLIAQSIRVYLANQRKAHAKVKDRGEVAGTTKKMWAQKGTGRARHGSAKAPLFVGGGSAHGPTGEQNYSLRLTKKMKKAALKALLTKFAQSKSIIVIDKVNGISPKTKDAVKLITGLKGENEVLSNSQKVGLITTKTLTNVKRAFGNLKEVKNLTLNSLNTFDLSNQNFLIISKKAVEKIGK